MPDPSAPLMGHCEHCDSPVVVRDGKALSVIDRSFVAERDRYREALRRVLRDRREPDKILMEIQMTLGLTVNDVKEIDRAH